MDSGEGSSNRKRPTRDQSKKSNINHHHHRIPGPAGVVQQALHRRDRGKSPETEWIPTQQYVDRAIVQPEYDETFQQAPWQMAIDMGYFDMDGYQNFETIKNSVRQLTTKRIELTVGVVKKIWRNSVGDGYQLELKDCSCDIGATLMNQVNTEGGLEGKIILGSVLVLKKIVVFHPGRGPCSNCYLNITINNVVLVIGPDGSVNVCAPPAPRT